MKLKCLAFNQSPGAVAARVHSIRARRKVPAGKRSNRHNSHVCFGDETMRETIIEKLLTTHRSGKTQIVFARETKNRFSKNQSSAPETHVKSVGFRHRFLRRFSASSHIAHRPDEVQPRPEGPSCWCDLENILELIAKSKLAETEVPECF